MSVIRDTERCALAWLLNSEDTGLSSKAIARHMLGIPESRYRTWAYPLDPGDLGRCLRLLDAIPEWKPRMREMASHGPVWAALVAHWDDLAASMEAEVGIDWSKGRSAPRTYARMRKIRETAGDRP